jgi:hypothetical protein
MGRLVERGARQFVAAPADASLHIRFAGLIASRGEAEMRAYVARPAEAIWLINSGAERQSGERARTHVILPISLHY